MPTKPRDSVEYPVYHSPDDAEATFYQAFEHADLSAMMTVWHDTNDVECIHPMGERLYGIDAVRRSWEQIFLNPPAICFRLEQRRIFRQGTLSIHLVNERMMTHSDRSQVFYVISTNIYQETPSGWRMIVHHASPAPRRFNERRQPLLH